MTPDDPDPLATEDAPGTFPPDVLALALLQLRAAGDHEAADALMQSHGGDDSEPATKAMSSLVGSLGGALVPPAAMAGKRRKRKRARRIVKAIFDSVEGA